MSKKATVWVVIIVVIVLIIISWAVWGGKSGAPEVSAPAAETAASTTPVTEAAPAVKSPLDTALTDTSDAALQADLDSVDTQIGSLNTDTANVNQSITESVAP